MFKSTVRLGAAAAIGLLANAAIAQSVGPFVVWRSSDQLVWKATEATIATDGSHPELLLLTKPAPARSGPDAGCLLLYTSKGAGLECLRSIDQGRTWTGGSSVTINGHSPELKGKDIGAPSVVQLDDGRVRLYFSTSDANPKPSDPRVKQPRDPRPEAPMLPGKPTPADPTPFPNPLKPDAPKSSASQPPRPSESAPAEAIHSAISNDGITFALEDGQRLSLPKAANPEVIRLPDTQPSDGDTRRIGPWLMFFSRGESLLLATSKDGLTWTRDETFVWEGVGRASALSAPGSPAPRSVRLFAMKGGALVSAVFDPSNGAIKEDAGSRIPDKGQDVTVAPAGDGSFLLINRRAAADKNPLPGTDPATLPGRPGRSPGLPTPPPSPK